MLLIVLSLRLPNALNISTLSFQRLPRQKPSFLDTPCSLAAQPCSSRANPHAFVCASVWARVPSPHPLVSLINPCLYSRCWLSKAGLGRRFCPLRPPPSGVVPPKSRSEPQRTSSRSREYHQDTPQVRKPRLKAEGLSKAPQARRDRAGMRTQVCPAPPLTPWVSLRLPSTSPNPAAGSLANMDRHHLLCWEKPWRTGDSTSSPGCRVSWLQDPELVIGGQVGRKAAAQGHCENQVPHAEQVAGARRGLPK